MEYKRIVTYVAMLLAVAAATSPAAGLSDQEQLGKNLFFDTNLSEPKGQSCADCHGTEVGFTGPDSTINALGAVYEGAVPGRFGNRKPPAASYAGDSPVLHWNRMWIGGMFWDGRATGWTLGDPLAEQAQGPFLNPLEQNNPSPRAVVDKVLASYYSPLFKQVCGVTYNVTGYYECVARSIAAYERSNEVTAFTSRYDYYLAGKLQLTAQEAQGLTLFEGKAMCANCHTSKPGPNNARPLFTDYTYDNLGIPKNPMNPFYYEPEWNPKGLAWVDEGLGGFLKSNGNSSKVYQPEMGKFKVPTLRNVDRRPSDTFIKAYGHNGYFKSLKQIVHFYNTRDALPTCNPKMAGLMPGVDCWPAPEVSKNINKAEMGNLGLNNTEEDAIVAFLKTLSDGYVQQ
ncbi:MAG TPA: cytochrome C [Candidatus Methanoperedenaceae archaeon]|nr:cytochrome C [Candidatus Methanoperedenaceae archaeon]